MRVVRYHEHGGPEVLQVDDVEPPEPGPGELRIDTRAVGVNPVDTYFREGSYPVPELPWIPGSDVAGVVDAAGRGAAVEPGTRVFATGTLGNDRQGTYAEQVLVPADWAAELPEGCAFEEGAALGLVGLTAWRAFVEFARVEPAERVLVHGGSGGVGHVAVQIADAMGARVTTTARRDYHDYLRRLGASTVVDYRQDDDELAAAITDAGAPDVVLDTHFDDYLQLDADVAAHGGRVVCIGNDAASARLDAAGAAKSKDVGFQFMTMFSAPDVGGALDRLATLAEDGRVVPEIARTYSLEEAAEAQRAVLRDSFRGKLVIVP